MYDVSRELLIYADGIEKMALSNRRDTGTSETEELSSVEDIRLRAVALKRKRSRIQFFNSSDGKSLRLKAGNHEEKHQGKALYCCLCDNNHNSSNVLFRGHRSTYMCSLCNVHLCVRTYPGLRKSCWDMWHSCRELVPK